MEPNTTRRAVQAYPKGEKVDPAKSTVFPVFSICFSCVFVGPVHSETVLEGHLDDKLELILAAQRPTWPNLARERHNLARKWPNLALKRALGDPTWRADDPTWDPSGVQQAYKCKKDPGDPLRAPAIRSPWQEH